MKDAIAKIFANEKRTDDDIEKSEAAINNALLVYLEKIIIDAITAAEHEIKNYDERDWHLTKMGNEKRMYLLKGEGLAVRRNVRVVVGFAADHVQLFIPNGHDLLMNLAKKNVIPTTYCDITSDGNIVNKIRELFDKFKSDGVAKIAIEFKNIIAN